MSGKAEYDRDTAYAAWQKQIRNTHVDGGRLLRGVPCNGAVLIQALRGAPLRQRHLRALELGLRTGGRVRLETLTWGWQQFAEVAGIQIPAAFSCKIPLEHAMQ